MRSDIVPGGTFPDYALPDHTGNVRTLSELRSSRDRLLAAQWLRRVTAALILASVASWPCGYTEAYEHSCV